MYKDFPKELKHERIALSNIKNEKNDDFHYYFYTEEEKKEKLKQKEELEKKCLELHYKIDETKAKELENVFEQTKQKIKFPGTPHILKKETFYALSNNHFTIYDNKIFKPLYEIKFEDEIISAIQLDNNDLAFLLGIKNDKNWRKKYQIHIFRMKDKKFELLQKITEDQTGYSLQYSHSGCMRYDKHYDADYIKELSGNRFICVTNYGYKIYSLNNSKQYSVILLKEHYENIKRIYEINENKFLFCTCISCGDSLGGPAHDILIIDINEICKNTKKEIFEYSTYGGYHQFSDFIIIKNNYFIIMVDNNILLIDLNKGKILKRFEILGLGSSYYYYIGICKWNNDKDNQFFIFKKGNLILFELNEESLELKIISQLYYPNIGNIQKITEKNNKFYSIEEDNNIIIY